MCKQEIMVIGEKGTLRGEELIVNVEKDSFVRIKPTKKFNECESNEEYVDSLIEPIYFGTIKDTITAKLLRAVATRKDLNLLSCNISEYNRTGDALVEDGEGRPSSLYYDAEKDKWI